MMPELVQSIELDNSGGLIMLGILYVVIAFGVFGTAMTMAAERRREFAILVSVGMKRWKMSVVVLLETILIGLIGLVLAQRFHSRFFRIFIFIDSAFRARLPRQCCNTWFEPVLAFGVSADIFLHQALVVLIISLVLTLYPIWSVGKFKIVNALRA